MDFDTWLTQWLLDLKTDEAVFGPYIKSIVEGDDDEEEKIEALDGILAELGDSSLDVESLRKEIISRWAQHVKLGNSKPEVMNGNSNTFLQSNTQAECGTTTNNTLDTQLENLLKISPQGTAANKSPAQTSSSSSTAVDSALRAAILKQYHQNETDSEDEDGQSKNGGLSGLDKNTNAERVLHDHKEQKEKQRADAAKKREKDREDRAKQKKLAEEKKEKAKQKTAKVERKR